MTNGNWTLPICEKELNKRTEERDAARRHVDRLKRQLTGAYALLIAHDLLPQDKELE